MGDFSNPSSISSLWCVAGSLSISVIDGMGCLIECQDCGLLGFIFLMLAGMLWTIEVMLGVNSPLPCMLEAEVVAWVGVVKVGV